MTGPSSALTGAYLGSYEISRLSCLIRALPFFAAASIVTSLFLFFYGSELDTIVAGGLAGIFFTAFVLTLSCDKYFHGKFWMKAYENGIEVIQIGFFPWDDVFFYHHGKNSMILLRHGGNRYPHFLWPGCVNAALIGYFEQWGR